jgi:meiotic recombination protein SPO11
MADFDALFDALEGGLAAGDDDPPSQPLNGTSCWPEVPTEKDPFLFDVGAGAKTSDCRLEGSVPASPIPVNPQLSVEPDWDDTDVSNIADPLADWDDGFPSVPSAAASTDRPSPPLEWDPLPAAAQAPDADTDAAFDISFASVAPSPASLSIHRPTVPASPMTVFMPPSPPPPPQQQQQQQLVTAASLPLFADSLLPRTPPSTLQPRVLRWLLGTAAEVLRRLERGEDPTTAFVAADTGQPLLPPLVSTVQGVGGAQSDRFDGAQELAGLLRVMATCRALLQRGCTASTREVYYLHAPFFRSQADSNAAIAKLCAAAGCARHELGLLAAARGWFAGRVRLLLDTADAFDAAATDSPLPGDQGGTPVAQSIPADAVETTADGPQSLRFVNCGAEFVLVVEKECIFRRLCEDRLWARLPCVVLTGCGFPDLATRAFLFHLHRQLRLPVFGLCDWNPFGAAILRCYRDGSRTTPQANRWTVPVRWLGVRCDDIETFAAPARCMQVLTAKDREKALAMLRDPTVLADADMVREIEVFLQQGAKMEIEGLLVCMDTTLRFEMKYESAFVHLAFIYLFRMPFLLLLYRQITFTFFRKPIFQRSSGSRTTYEGDIAYV